METSRSAPIVLALRALKLGDLLVAVPALKGLRRGYPHHRIVFAGPAWLGPLVELIDAIDGHLPVPGLDHPLPVTHGTVDVAVNLHGNGRESRTRVAEIGARRVIDHRSEHHPEGIPWVDGMLERERWARLVRSAECPASANDVAIRVPAANPAEERAVVLHVGAFYGSRQWPVDRFAEVARALAATGYRVVFTGGDAERERAEAVRQRANLPADTVLAGRLSLDAFAATIADARLVVSADTGAAHLASAYGTPSVVLFGPAPPAEWGPPPGPHVVLTDERVRRGDAFAAEPDPAILAVSVDDVLNAVRSLGVLGGEFGAQGREDPLQKT